MPFVYVNSHRLEDERSARQLSEIVTVVHDDVEDRDLAHEHDMAQLRREQLRADFSDEELEDLAQARLEDEDRFAAWPYDEDDLEPNL